MHKLTSLGVAAAVLISGCVDLDVMNPNEPDRDRVLSSPQDVQSLISTSYQAYFDNAQQTNPNLPTAAMADMLTGGFFDFGVFDVTTEPREIFDASPLNTRGFVGRAPWSRLYPVISNVNDGLGAIDRGLRIVIDGADHTPRALAFGKFVQGISHGYLALYYDQALIITEDVDLEQMDPRDFRPYPEVRAEALAMLDEAISIAQANTFTIPASSAWINGVTLTNQDLIRVINSYYARILAYSPRTWEERAAVDWNEVLRRIDAGITQDFAPEGQLNVWESNMRRLYARVRTRPSDHVRPDNRMLGPADTSGAFQVWHATPSANRQQFQVRTTDRRIHGAAGPTTLGKYFGWDTNAACIWPLARGTYRCSRYFYRTGAGNAWFEGPQVTMSRTEMDLLKAEALIRLNRAAEAVPLINRSRVANGELPPVTIEGPPLGTSCVPRKVNGECGSLWDALMHERAMENTDVEGAIMWWDFRGLNRLQEGTLLHFPVSGIELENLGMQVYTFGGVGGQGAAPPPQYNRCPATLPRCN